MVCMRIILEVNEGCVKLSSNDTIFDYSWFSRFKTTEEANTEGLDYCGPLKTTHKVFCLAKLEKPDKIFDGMVSSCYED